MCKLLSTCTKARYERYGNIPKGEFIRDVIDEAWSSEQLYRNPATVLDDYMVLRHAFPI